MEEEMIEIKNRRTGEVLLKADRAELHEADLHGADLRGANLGGATARSDA
jgi:uncharacterized protein YjbI with pentapeptide repeats